MPSEFTDAALTAIHRLLTKLNEDRTLDAHSAINVLIVDFNLIESAWRTKFDAEATETHLTDLRRLVIRHGELAGDEAAKAFSEHGDASVPLRNSVVLHRLRETLDLHIERAAKFG